MYRSFGFSRDITIVPLLLLTLTLYENKITENISRLWTTVKAKLASMSQIHLKKGKYY